MDQHKTNLSSGINFAEESVKLGLPVHVHACILHVCTYILCVRVTVNPKFSGQKLLDATIRPKIKKFKQ